MKFYILTRYKIHSLETSHKFSDIVFDELIELVKDRYTRVIGNETVANDILATEKELKYKYVVKISKEFV